MFRRSRPFAAGAAVAFLTIATALFPGCAGEDKPPVDTSSEEATVKGTVTFNGKPVAKGEVAFDPSNYLRKSEAARRAPIGPDGTYSVKTLVGANRVSFSIPEMARDPGLQDLSLEYDVKSGENAYDIVLPPEGGGAPTDG
ncbi:MAG: hypothetical protein AB7I30_21425 [Isosphaeraceae bacterium]